VITRSVLGLRFFSFFDRLKDFRNEISEVRYGLMDTLDLHELQFSNFLPSEILFVFVT
jgi:hypothetical protein